MKKLIALALGSMILLSGCSTTVPHIHTYDEGVCIQEPNCLNDGVLLRTCQADGETIEEKIPALGHDYKFDHAEQATVFTSGNSYEICQRCGDVSVSEIPKLSYEIKQSGDDLCFYVGEETVSIGLMEWKGDYYFFGEEGKAIKSSVLSLEQTNGFLESGVYSFDESGKMRQGSHAVISYDPQLCQATKDVIYADQGEVTFRLTPMSGYEINHIEVIGDYESLYLTNVENYEFKMTGISGAVEVKYALGVGSPLQVDRPLGFTSKWVESGDGLQFISSYDFKELPAVVIHTEGNAPIVSKTEYLSSTVSILNTEDEIVGEVAGVRGRGNSSWLKEKKGYRIKFDKKQSVFGSEYKAKSWTLIPNYLDRTLSRNEIAFSLASQMQGMEFTSVGHYVDLYLNDEYLGVYLLCDQMQTGKGRVDIDESFAPDDKDFGFLLEMDARANLDGVNGYDYFWSGGRMYAVKTPDTGDEAFAENSAFYVETMQKVMDETQEVLGLGDWNAVQSVIDVDSFVDSYIIYELFENLDTAFYSWFIYRDRGGKLTAGPVWDFDLAGGNYYRGIVWKTYSPDRTLRIADTHPWYGTLLTYDQFRRLVYEHLNSYEEMFRVEAERLHAGSETYIYDLYREAIDRNFEKWQILGQRQDELPKDVQAIATVDGQFEYFYNWLTTRYEYLKQSYAV